MAYTIDRRPGTSFREVEFQVASTGAATVVSAQGGIRYNGTAFQMLDVQGQYDPRKQALLDHAVTFDMPHLLANGSPVVQGAVKVTTYISAFVSSEIWYRDSSLSVRISAHQINYVTGNFLNPISESWTIYAGDASNTPLHVVTDTVMYEGVKEVSRRRVYS